MRAAAQIIRLAEQAISNVNQPTNASKGCWRNLSRRRLFWLLLVEVWELGQALWVLYVLRVRYGRTPQWEIECRTYLARDIEAARQHVKYEAGDCAAFLAFLVDRV